MANKKRELKKVTDLVKILNDIPFNEDEINEYLEPLQKLKQDTFEDRLTYRKAKSIHSQIYWRKKFNEYMNDDNKKKKSK